MTKHEQALTAALEWVRNIHPGATAEGVDVRLTWQEWNALRQLLGLSLQEPSSRLTLGT